MKKLDFDKQGKQQAKVDFNFQLYWRLFLECFEGRKYSI